MLAVYVASKSKFWPWWCAIRGAGINIISTWLDWSHNHDDTEPTADEWARHWESCVSQAASADITLMMAPAGDNQNGALVEVGAALGAGKQVWVVSPHDWSWRHHERVRNFETLEGAISALAAQQVGERLRRVA
jgi:hypothetical protein